MARSEATTALRFVMSGERAVSAVFDKLSIKKKELTKDPAVVEVDADDNPFQKKVDTVQGILKKVGEARAVAELDVNDKDAVAKVAAFDLMLDRLNKRVVNPKIKAPALDALMVQALRADAAVGKLNAPRLPSGAAGGAAGGAGGLTQGALPVVGSLPPQVQAVALGAAIAALPFIAQVAAGGIVLAMGGAFAAIAAIGASKSKSVQNSFAKLKKSASADLIAIGKPFIPVMNSIIDTVKNTMNRLTPVFTTIATVIGGPLQSVIDIFIGSFSDPAWVRAFQAIGKAFGDVMSALAPMLQGALDHVAGGFTKIAQAVSKNPRAIASFVAGMIQVIGLTLDIIAALARVGNWIEAHWDLMKWIVVPEIVALRFAISHFAAFRHETAVIFNGVRHDIAHIWDMIFQNTIGSQIRFVHNVEAWFNNLRHGIANIFNATRHNIAATWNSIWANTVTRVVNGINSVINWVRTLPGRITGALGNAGTRLLGWGSGVIRGLLKGMTNVVGEVWKFVKAIPGKILSFLGINSPPQWAIDAGKHIMNGLGIGMSQAKNILGKAVTASTTQFSAANLAAGVGGAAGSVMATMHAMANAAGWGNQWGDLNYLEMREAGYNLRAVNPSSGAAGIAQFINGFGEYYQYGGNPNTAVGQITGFFNYIRQRYGNPSNAAAHERAFNWYGAGTNNARGWAIVGEHGPEAINFGRGPGTVISNNSLTRGNHYHLTVVVRGALSTDREIQRAVADGMADFERHGGSVPWASK